MAIIVYVFRGGCRLIRLLQPENPLCREQHDIVAVDAGHLHHGNSRAAD
jgi:hypothetical protein